MINLDTIIGIVLGLPLGILIGYVWRNQISRKRRARALAEQFERERELRAQERNAAEAAAQERLKPKTNEMPRKRRPKTRDKAASRDQSSSP
jgi:hypothetical protein